MSPITVSRSTPVPRRVRWRAALADDPLLTIAIVACLGALVAGTAGYVMGQSNATTVDEVAALERGRFEVALQQARGDAEAAGYQSGRQAGLRAGERAGERAGARAGAQRGAAAVERVKAEQAAIAEAEAAAALAARREAAAREVPAEEEVAAPTTEAPAPAPAPTPAPPAAPPATPEPPCFDASGRPC